MLAASTLDPQFSPREGVKYSRVTALQPFFRSHVLCSACQLNLRLVLTQGGRGLGITHVGGVTARRLTLSFDYLGCTPTNDHPLLTSKISKIWVLEIPLNSLSHVMHALIWKLSHLTLSSSPSLGNSTQTKRDLKLFYSSISLPSNHALPSNNHLSGSVVRTLIDVKQRHAIPF
jgi:hypothetical protein